MEKTKRRVMTQIETVRMSQLMSHHIIKHAVIDGEEPLCEYLNDYDDEKIAREIAPDLTAIHAGGLRKNIFGNLRKPTMPAPDVELIKRVEQLELALGNALNYIHDITLKHDRLCMALTIARVGVDCKHLVIDPKNNTAVVEVKEAVKRAM